MPQISVVVPVYEVEPYLEECLQSLAAQTVPDFEAILVDDGSTDASAPIAARFADADARFRVFRQPHGGLGRARNLGADLASGEYLAFLDSDDVLPPDAYERLLGSLCRTGSDFATGNVQRLTAGGLAEAPFLAGAFTRDRMRAHVRRFEPLLTDRTACNKLWRRSFWDAQRFRFPVGRVHEDIPVVIPAHYRARSVDVLREPVYRYRQREGSITQRRHELGALRDRLAAVDEVHAFIGTRESSRQLRRYQRSVFAHDLRYHLNLLHVASAEYRALFMERVSAFLDAAGRGVLDGLPAADRAKYELVRRGRLEELLELVSGERGWAPLRRRGLRYRAVYPAGEVTVGRRDKELALTARLDDVRVDDGRLRIAGHAFVNALGARWPDAQRVELCAVRPGGRRPLRMRFASQAVPTAAERRRDLAPELRWAGFTASLRADTLLDGDAWELFASARSGGVRRRRAVFELADPSLAGTYDLPVRDDALVRFTLGADGRAAVTVARRWLRIDRYRRIGGSVLELSGPARLADRTEVAVGERRFPVVVSGGIARMHLPLAELAGTWDIVVPGAVVSLDDGMSGLAWLADGREITLERTPAGTAGLTERAPEPQRASPSPWPARARAGAR